MTLAEQELATLGFGRSGDAPAVWRVKRVDEPLFTDGEPDPADSEALQHWRKLLARGRRPSPYRITRIRH